MKQLFTLVFFSFLYCMAHAQIPAAGNVLWLKADAGVYTDAGTTTATNGQTVQQWNDQSSNNNHAAQATSNLRPVFVTNVLNGQPVLRFSSHMLVTPSLDLTTTDKADFYIVYKSSNLTGNWEVIAEHGPDYNNFKGFAFFDNAQSPLPYRGMYPGHSGGGYNTKDYPFKANVFKVVNTSFDRGAAVAGETSLRVNGKDAVLYDQSAPYNTDLTGNYDNRPLYIGNRGNAVNSYPLVGDIAEIILYNRKLTAGEKTTIETYLNAKYGIQCSVNNPLPGSGNCLRMGTYGAYAQDDADIDFGSNDFTIEFWTMKRALSSGGSNTACINKWNTGASPGTNEWAIQTSTNGTDNIPAFFFESGATYYQANATTSLTTNKWYHIAAAREGNNIKIYVNGILEGTAAIPPGASVNNVAARTYMALGYYPGGFGNNSDLDELRIWNTALSQTTIRDWMCKKETALHPNHASLARYYRFDEAAGLNIWGNQQNSCVSELYSNGAVTAVSGAPIGDVSAHDYTANTASANTSFGTPSDNLSVTMNAGTSAGVHVYGVNELPNNQGYPGLTGNNKYGGVFVVNGNTAAAYTANYNYTNNAAVTPALESSLKLYKRTDNAAVAVTDWTLASNQNTNIASHTISATGQQTEYVLGVDIPAFIVPTCPAKFDGAGSYVNISNTPATMPNTGTIEFWMNQPSFSDWQIPLATFSPTVTSGTFTDGMYFQTYANGNLYFIYASSYSVYGIELIGTLLPNKNYHVALSWDLTAQKIKGYLDGHLIFIKSLTTTFPTSLPDISLGGGFANTRFYNGTLDEVRYWNIERTQAQIISSASGSLTGNESGLAAYYHFNENALGGNGQTVLNKAVATGAALNGTTVSSNSYPKFPCSLNPPTCAIKLNGTADYVQMPYNAALSLTQFTLAAWVKTAVNNAGYQTVIIKQFNASTANYVLYIHNNKAEVAFISGGVGQTVTGTSNINDGAWHFISGTYDGSSLKIYTDAVLENTLATTQTPSTSALPFALGAWPGGIGNYLNGSMDEASVWNTAKNAAGVFTLMNTPPAGNEPGLVAYYNFNDNNRSGQNRTVTNYCTATGSAINGTTVGSAVTPLFDCAPPPFTEPECNMQLNGANDYISAPNHAAINVTQFSAGAYFKTTNTGALKTIIYKDADGTNANYHLSVSATNKAQISFVNTSLATITATGTTTITDGAWHYAVGTFDGSNLKIYVDGVLEATTSSATIPVTGTNLLYLGATNSGANKMNGSVDELSIWNTALSLTQVQNLVGQRLVGNETGLTAYYNFASNNKNGQGQTILNSCTATGSALNGTVVGTATTPVFTCSALPVTPPACAIMLNGWNDGAYMNNGLGSYPSITNNFTMEVKAKPLLPQGNATAAQYGGIFDGQRYVLGPDQGEANYAPGHAGVGISLGTNGIAVHEHASNYIPARIILNNHPVNDWVHLSLVCTNGVLKLYENGALVATASASGYTLHPSGHISYYYGKYAGYVGEVRIWNTALSGDQIRTNLNANLTGAETNLVGLYKFSNASANGPNQTLTGLGTLGTSNPYVTSGSNGTPIFTCANTSNVNKDTLPGSGIMYAHNNSGIEFAELGNLGNTPAQGSLMVWLNASSLKEKAVVFSTSHFRDTAGAYKGIKLFSRADGRLQLSFGTDTTVTGYQDTVTVLNNFTANKWYHVALTWDTAAKTYTVYINGIQTVTGSTNFWPQQFESFKAGIGYKPSATYTWAGNIDELSEWNKILSQTEIRDQLTSKIRSSQTNWNNVLHYYRFDNNFNSTVLYPVVNDFKGTVHGMVYQQQSFTGWYPMPTSSAPIGLYSSYQYAGNTSTTSLSIGNGGSATNADAVTASLTSGTADGIHVYGEDVWPNTVNGVVDTLAGSHRYAGVFVVNPNNAQYTLVYDYTNNPFVTVANEPYLKLKKRDNNAVTVWIAPSNMTLNPVANTITCTGENTEYILEKSLVALPVKWLSFTAQLNGNNQSVLNWKVNSELNVKYYVVEWSTDAVHYQTIATIAYNPLAAGNYNAVHVLPSKGNNYYRIRQTDNDGRFSYTGIQLLKLADMVTVSVYPNPASNVINISGWNFIQHMELYDISGRLIKSWQQPAAQIDVTAVPGGTYMLKAVLKTGTVAEQKMVVQH